VAHQRQKVLASISSAQLRQQAVPQSWQLVVEG
jgi:hypothetical protein